MICASVETILVRTSTVPLHIDGFGPSTILV